MTVSDAQIARHKAIKELVAKYPEEYKALYKLYYNPATKDQGQTVTVAPVIMPPAATQPAEGSPKPE